MAPGFEPVHETFRENFESRRELGAACAVVHEGAVVVDLWGGYRDTGRTDPWTADTLVLVFSTTKGIAGGVMAHAHSEGLFDYDDPAADYWPAFGQQGKDDVTIRQLLAHQAGLAGIETTLTPAKIADRDGLVDLLARKEPDWEPGTRHGYHAWSLGWYESELLRRAAPGSRTLGRYLREELAGPLDADIYVGLPDEDGGVSETRIAEVQSFGPLDLLRSVGSFPPGMLLGLANPWSLTTRAMSPFDVSTPAELNDPAYRRLEIPAGNGVCRVRDLARFYADLIDEDGFLDAETREALAASGTPPTDGTHDVILHTDTAYSLGFWKPFDGFRFGSSSAFGAPGAGGSFAFADPERELAFAYAPNRMGTHVWDDPRETALREAVLDCL
ncbi:serine hydrolase domain-containing protein [Salinirubrum litoreum]|uniref:Serine hydrolase domain-containing protein n=1 Tax=Salinirubrum litoreum TaxID=1126234 RepID=A0ABD5RG26_9EURY